MSPFLPQQTRCLHVIEGLTERVVHCHPIIQVYPLVRQEDAQGILGANVPVSPTLPSPESVAGYSHTNCESSPPVVQTILGLPPESKVLGAHGQAFQKWPSAGEELELEGKHSWALTSMRQQLQSVSSVLDASIGQCSWPRGRGLFILLFSHFTSLFFPVPLGAITIQVFQSHLCLQICSEPSLC